MMRILDETGPKRERHDATAAGDHGCKAEMTENRLGASRLGFGCAHLSPRSSASETLALLEKALDCGIRHYDTARMYGAGAAERLLGPLAKRRRDEMIIVSKAGISPRSRARRALSKVRALLTGRHDPGPFRFADFEPNRVRRSIETSLRELQTDYLDALLLHEATPADITDELKRLLTDLRQHGKVRRVGIATSPEHSAALASLHTDLCGIMQIVAPPPGASLPKADTLIVHSVLGARLSAFVARMRADTNLTARFARDVGADGTDPEAAARLFLAYEMARNKEGVVLVSSVKARHIEQNGALLAAPPSTEQQAAFERFMHTA
jgi:D-threo-aldose 1-dehydrogenase